MARNVQIELGDAIPSAQQQIIKDLKKEDMAQTELTMSVRDSVNELIERGIEFYWGEDGYNYDLEVGNEYNFPAGMYSFDAPLDEYDQITKWVYVGAGKIVVSNEKNADGSWVLKTILDGDGLGTDTVGANNILANSIDTDHLATDVLTASNIQIGDADQQTLEQKLTELSEADETTYLQAKEDAEEASRALIEAQIEAEVVRSNAYSDGTLTLAEQEAVKQAEQALSDAKVHAEETNAELEKTLLEKIGEIDYTTYIYTDDSGDLHFAKPNSEIEMVLTNDRLSFYEDGVEVAYISNKQLYITSSTVVNDLNIGEKWKFEVSPKNNLNLSWVG